MAKKKHHRRTKKRTVKRSRKKRTVRRKAAKSTTRKASTKAVYKKKLRNMAKDALKDGLYRREIATTRKQHIVAQKKIAAARRDLHKYE